MSSPNEKIYDFLAGQVAPYKGPLPSMWAKFLAKNGFSNKPIQKGIYQYLGTLGYDGIFAKRWAEWYNEIIVKNSVPAPTITSSANQSVPENTPVSIVLTANQPVTWSIVGGPDAALFDISNQNITGGSFDFEAPVDVGANNVYNFTIRATNTFGKFTNQAFTLTVTDVAEIVNVINPANWTGGGYGGMSISGGQLIWSGTVPYDGFGNTGLALVAGKYYQLEYTISSYTTGSVRPDLLGGVTRSGVVRSANGSYKERLLVNTSNNQLYFLSVGDPGPNTYRVNTNCILRGPYNTNVVDGS